MKPLLRAVSLALATLPLCPLAALQAQATPCLDTSPNDVYDDRVSMGGPNLLYAVKFQNGTAPLAVTAVETFTGERGGSGASLGIWAHDSRTNEPAVDLGTGSWTVTQANCWQGAVLPNTVTIPAGSAFWIVFGPPNGAQSPIERVNSGATQQYRGSFDGGQTWNGPFTRYDHKFRLYCGGKTIGSFVTLGTNCPRGSRVLNPRIGGCIASIGGSLDLTLSRADPNQMAILGIGFSDQVTAGGIPLPIDLTPLGAPGCSAYVDIRVAQPITTDSSGDASFSFPLPAHPALVGNPVFGQWFQPVQRANLLGLIASDYARVTLGN